MIAKIKVFNYLDLTALHVHYQSGRMKRRNLTGAQTLRLAQRLMDVVRLNAGIKCRPFYGEGAGYVVHRQGDSR